MIDTGFENNLAYAKHLDETDNLAKYRSLFHIPKQKNGEPFVYLCGNSLGLQPKATTDHVMQEITDWQNLGVEGHLHAKNPWMPYHESLTNAMAKVVGAKPDEVVIMNTLTVNLHLMMVSFYQPKGNRNKIVIESDAFPSDRYAVESQIKFHGLSPNDCLITLKPREGEYCLREDDILSLIEQEGDQIALILLGNTNYYTGQFFDMKPITRLGHAKGCKVGFDCAHGAGNLPLELHESGCDFAVWCNYKYLNAGPGGLGGIFVHERYRYENDLPRFTGWWGHNKDTRFKMRDDFDPLPGAEAWQLSNPPILAMASAWAALKLFDEIGMEKLRIKAIALTGYLEYLINSISNSSISIITPSSPSQRGSQLSIKLNDADNSLFQKITKDGVIADWREPNVIRVAPVPMYNSFEDVFNFYRILKHHLIPN